VAPSANSMLSRILSEEEVASVQPLVWHRSLSGAAAATVPVAGARADQVYRPANTEQQIQALQARIAELEALMERRVQETKAAAYREGEAAGRNQGTAQVQPVLEKLAHSIREVGELRPKLRHEAEEDLLKLALAIARKILHRELSADPDSIAGLIRVAVEKVRMQEILRVRIHPQHHPVVQQILTRIATGTPIEIQPDPRLQLGSVVVETSRGEFDASVDLQLKEIERGLTDRLTKR
jgi:flagellar assembly protein FliH